MMDEEFTRALVRLEGREWVYVDPCPGCGKRHRHGADNPAEPGSRVVHCPGLHRRFRDDCERQKGSPYCRVEHLPPTTVVDLVLA